MSAWVTSPTGKSHRMVTPELAYCGAELREGRRTNNPPRLGRCSRCEDARLAELRIELRKAGHEDRPRRLREIGEIVNGQGDE